MLKIDKESGEVIMRGNDITIGGELCYLMMKFYKKYGAEKFAKCMKAFKQILEEEKTKTTYHIELVNGNKKPIIIEGKNIENVINKINKLNIPEQVKKYVIENLKKESNK